MISNNKLLHIIGVARQCEAIAKARHMSEEEQLACFMMGLLHDIGYEKAINTEEHPQVSVDMLDVYVKYKKDIDNAIKNHGYCYNDMTVFDEILNTADLTIDSKGDEVTIDDRLTDIRSRHGENSEHYKLAINQANNLPLYNSLFDDAIEYYRIIFGE